MITTHPLFIPHSTTGVVVVCVLFCGCAQAIQMPIYGVRTSRNALILKRLTGAEDVINGLKFELAVYQRLQKPLVYQHWICTFVVVFVVVLLTPTHHNTLTHRYDCSVRSSGTVRLFCLCCTPHLGRGSLNYKISPRKLLITFTKSFPTQYNPLVEQ
jgi:hypothetical protein